MAQHWKQVLFNSFCDNLSKEMDCEENCRLLNKVKTNCQFVLAMYENRGQQLLIFQETCQNLLLQEEKITPGLQDPSLEKFLLVVGGFSNALNTIIKTDPLSPDERPYYQMALSNLMTAELH